MYNTINIKGAELKQARNKTSRQKDKVLQFFKNNPASNYTPFDVHRILGLNCPVTSIRRAITDLTEQGELVKTDQQRRGEYGTKNYCWRLKFKTTLF